MHTDFSSYFLGHICRSSFVLVSYRMSSHRSCNLYFFFVLCFLARIDVCIAKSLLVTSQSFMTVAYCGKQSPSREINSYTRWEGGIRKES